MLNLPNAKRPQDFIWLRISFLLLCLVFTKTTVHAQSAFSEIIIFGDSLSDTGNLAGVVTPNLPPPYFNNRISNGPLAIDYVAESLGVDAVAAAAGGRNYAVVGGNIKGEDFEDLSQQVTRFLDSQAINDADNLYFLMLGGNDLRGLRGQPNHEIASLEIELLVTSLLVQIRRLYVAGARQFFIATAPDIGNIPQTIDLEPSDPGIRLRASSYVQTYNQALMEELQGFVAESDATVYEYDINIVFNDMLQRPLNYGFELTDIGCFDPDSYSLHPQCDTILFPLTEPDFEKFVFFDSIHPTGKAHNIVGQAMSARLLQPPLAAKAQLSIVPLLYLLLDD